MTARVHRADAPLSYEEYLRFEESVDCRHEFIDGDVLAMAGGTRRHAVLKSRVSTELTLSLGRAGPWRVEDSDTRIAVERGDRIHAYYPDSAVICGEGITHARDPDGGVLDAAVSLLRAPTVTSTMSVGLSSTTIVCSRRYANTSSSRT